LLETVEKRDFPRLEWPEARERLLKLPLTKYCDFNLVNLIKAKPNKTTLEIRVLPGSVETDQILRAACLVEELFDQL
jgi:hypothetical protein